VGGELVVDERRLIAYKVVSGPSMRLVRAPRLQGWIDETNQQFAANCLPLMIANLSGWFLLNSQAFSVTWNGGRSIDSVSIVYQDGEEPRPASSHFGEGILTFQIPFLFRTPPGWNLLARGPANLPKAGISPLEGVIETDWSTATFTMNWQLTTPGQPVSFEVDEPICMIVPQRRSELESFYPEIAGIGSNRNEYDGYVAWRSSRTTFNEELRVPDSQATKDKRQRHYLRGTTPDGKSTPEHQLVLKLRDFIEFDGICPPPDNGDAQDVAGFELTTPG